MDGPRSISFSNGVVEIGAPGFEEVVVLPGMVALQAWVLAVVLVPILLVLRGLTRISDRVVTVGHLVTLVMIAGVLVSQYLPSATGWELVLLGQALVVGQSLVAFGLILGGVQARRTRGSRPA